MMQLYTSILNYNKISAWDTCSGTPKLVPATFNHSLKTIYFHFFSLIEFYSPLPLKIHAFYMVTAQKKTLIGFVRPNLLKHYLRLLPSNCFECKKIRKKWLCSYLINFIVWVVWYSVWIIQQFLKLLKFIVSCMI